MLLKLLNLRHLFMQMYRMGVVNVTRIAAALQEWDEPSFDAFRAEPRNVWRLFNATTFALTGRVTENPRQPNSCTPSSTTPATLITVPSWTGRLFASGRASAEPP